MTTALAVSTESWKTRFILASAGVMLLWVSLDFSLIGKEIVFLGHALLSPFYLLRSLAIAGSAFFLVRFAVLRGRRSGNAGRVLSDRLTFDLGMLGRIRVPGWLLPGVSLLVAAGCFGLFMVRPTLFNHLAKEDKIVEVLSALLLFLSSGIFIVLFCYARVRARQGGLFSLTLLLMGLVFLLIGMEEVSWFQRTLGFHTPGAFDANLQGEFNLHNFATDYVELAYYFSSFVFLIFLPFLHDQTDIFDCYPRLASLIPGRMILFASAAIVAFTYDTWNSSLDQLAFFFTLFVVIHYLYESLTSSGQQSMSPILPAIVLVGLMVLQVGFLAFGDAFICKWDVTEYKELLIPLGFWMYSLSLLSREAPLTAVSAAWTSVAITLLMAALRLFQKYRV